MQTSETLANKANEVLGFLSKEEKLRWQQHELTQALTFVARSCIASLQEGWEAGSFTTETMEGTMMKNAEAIGTASAWRDVLEFIEDITLEEEVQ